MESSRIKKYLLYIQDEAHFIETAIADMDREGLERNPILMRALERSIETIGEATSKVRPDLEAKYPNVSWRQIVGMRNILAHVYWEVDLELVWEVSSVYVPQLSKQVRQILLEL